MSSTLEDCGDGTFLPYCVIEGSRHHVNPRRSAKQCASHIDNEGGGAGPLDLVVVATFFGIKILLLSAEYTLVSEETKKDKAIAVWWARGEVFFPQHLGRMEPGGVDEQFFENSERLDRRPAPLQLLNLDDKDIPTLVLARDKNDQFYGVVAPLPCKTTSCSLPRNVDDSVFTCQQCQCFMHEGCVHKKVTEEGVLRPVM